MVLADSEGKAREPLGPRALLRVYGFQVTNTRVNSVAVLPVPVPVFDRAASLATISKQYPTGFTAPAGWRSIFPRPFTTSRDAS